MTLHTVIGVAHLGEPVDDREPLEDGAVSESRDCGPGDLAVRDYHARLEGEVICGEV